MARKTDIRLRRSAVSGAVPSTTDLNLGELALNTYDGKLYAKKSVGGTESIVELSGGGGTAQNTIWTEFIYSISTSTSTISGADDNGNALAYLTGALQVFVNGILQDPNTDYTATSGTSVVLTNAVSSGDHVQIAAFSKLFGAGDIAHNNYSGDGTTTQFTLGAIPGDENNTNVFVDGVYQNKSTYSVSGNTLTFSTAPDNGTDIDVMIGTRNVSLGSTEDLTLGGNLNVGGDANLSSSYIPHASTLTYTVKVITKTAAHRYNGSGSGSGYTINDSESPTLKLVPGRTYRFDQADSSNSGHPFRFYYEADKTTAYTTGITTNGTAGSAGAYTEIVVGDSTPSVLHYQCSAHGYMGNQVEIASRNLTGYDSDDLSEGSTNLFHTNERVDDRVNALITAGTNITTSYDDAAGTLTINSSGKTQEEIEDIVDGLLTAGTGISLSYNDAAGTLTISGSSAYTDSDARSAISVTDSGGDGSLTYSSGTGVITYTGPSQTEVRAHLSAGTGVTYSGGVIGIGQAVATTDNVTFNDLQVDGNTIITGNLTVNGTQTTLSTATLTVEDLNITVGSGATTSAATNGAGLTFGAWSSGTIPTLTWNSSNSRLQVNKRLFSSVGFTGDVIGNLTGNVNGNVTGTVSDISNHDTNDLTEGTTNLYYTSARSNSDFDTRLATKDTGDLSEGTNLYYTDARVSTRVDTILNHSNHTNVSVSKVGNELRLVAAATYGDSDVESYLDTNGTTFPDNVKARFGTGNDLNIFHDGSNNYIQYTSGNLILKNSTADFAVFNSSSSAVELYFNGSKKFETTSAGVQTTGTVNVNGAFALPTSDGSSNQVLQTDGSGNVSWATVSASSTTGLVSEAFKNIVVSGQSNIVADSATDSLTIAAGTGITLTTNAGTDTLTIANSAVGDNAFGNVAVSGQTTVAADSTNDTLTLVGTNGVDITTDAGSDTITINGRTSYSPFSTDLFTGNGTDTDFVLSQTPNSEDNLIVFVEGVYQNKNSYSLSSSTITMDTAIPNGQELIVHTVGDVVSGVGLSRDNFTGDGSTTAYTLSLDPLHENNLFVYFDGVYQEKSEFSVSGTTLTFSTAPDNGDSIEVIVPQATEIQTPSTNSINAEGQFNTSNIIPNIVTETTVASTSATTIASHSASTYRTIKYLVQCTQGTDYHSTEINLIHDGTTVYMTEYGTLYDNASLGTFDASISSGNIELKITAGSSTSMVTKVISTAVEV